MVPDESPNGAEPDETTNDDPVRTVLFGLAGNPGRSLAVAVAVLVVLLYAVLIQQELLLVVWLLLTGFLVYLFWRFVRAHERIAGAVERLADGD